MTHQEVDLPPYPRRSPAQGQAAAMPFRQPWSLKRLAVVVYALLAVAALSLTQPKEALQWLTR